MATETISMVRGDTKVLYLTPYFEDDETIALESGDVMYIAIFSSDGSLVIGKRASADDQDPDTHAVTIEIRPEDTQAIEITEDTSFDWEGEIVRADGDVLTPYFRRKLKIMVDRITPEIRNTIDGGGSV